MAQQVRAPRRIALSKERVLRAAIALADREGIESLSMRRLAETFGVVPMALYKHVANKDELLDGMTGLVVTEIDPPLTGTNWKGAVRERILSARRMLLRHPWASEVIESRTNMPPNVMKYMDSMIGMFRAGGFSLDLVHHTMHAMGSRILGFSQELFDDSAVLDPEQRRAMQRQLAGVYPHIVELTRAVYHDEESVVGPGCDDQAEFEFALDLVLEGLERLRKREKAARGGNYDR